MTLSPATEKFISTWGEMASKWCVNRTVAEVHAFFFLSAEPMSAEDVSRALAYSRSNVSLSLRELESRGLISPIHVRGDRKQYYEATKDPWEAFRTIIDDQKRRVVDPAVSVFRSCLEEEKRNAPEDSYRVDRMRDIVTFFDAINPLYNELRRLPNGPIQNLLKVTAKIREIIG